MEIPSKIKAKKIPAQLRKSAKLHAGQARFSTRF